MNNLRFVLSSVFVFSVSLAQAQDYQPKIAPASGDAERAKGSFQVPTGWEVKLVAAEPMLANPVAFCIDEHGRFYVCETFRQQKGVEDNRSHRNWLEADLAAETLDDRLKMFQTFLKDKGESYKVEHDRIRLLVDSDGDGQLDEATVFADGFNDILAGTGAGVLARKGQVFYTCIPDLWLLNDKDNDGVADTRNSLHNGYGIRVAFRGHDMHGLVIGPDGKLYYSIGDRGYNVKTPEGKHLKRPDTGAVFRCNLDGSDLEVFAHGLRNPQELAFDDYGNLFTGDNNSDSGDKARWVHIVEGSDTGWRMYYQYLSDRGPWNREKLWHPAHKDQAAYIVPPITNIADGPSGLVYYPGVGLSERYKGHFFLADFRGDSGRSGIRSFAMKPKGASFELVDAHEPIWRILGTDVDFGYDGRMYISDWVAGWDGPGKGRIYSFADPEGVKRADQAGGAALMKEGFVYHTIAGLVSTLDHPDRRIRQEVQFKLVEKKAVSALADVAVNTTGDVIPRLHGIWGLGQLARAGQNRSSISVVARQLLKDKEVEVRAHAARILGEGRFLEAATDLIPLLKDDSPRVQMFAALALAKLQAPSAIEPLLALLQSNADTDPTLRHAVVMGLVGSANGDAAKLLAHRNHPSRSVRLGLVLALRRYRSPQIAAFLGDSDDGVVLEAARAINDEPIEKATAALAALAGRPNLSAPLLRRVLNANFRLGEIKHAEAVAKVAADPKVDEALRLEAIEELSLWANPPKLDRVLGSWRPLEKRNADGVAMIIQSSLGGLSTGSNKVRQASVKLAAKYDIKEIAPQLLSMLKDRQSPIETRLASLTALHTLNDSRLAEAVQLSLLSKEPKLRAEARDILAKLDPGKAMSEFQQAMETGTVYEQQSALKTLGTLPAVGATDLIIVWIDRLLKGDVPLALQLDLLTAAKNRDNRTLMAKLDAYNSAREQDGPLALYRECLEGGDRERGSELFFSRGDLSCRRCHKVQDSGGNVGPDLSDIGKKKDRKYLLESLVMPDKEIAKGFETMILVTDEGKTHTGIVREQTDDDITLITPEGQLVTVAKDVIDLQRKGKSGMPEDLVKKLTKEDIRDLVEFLSHQKTPPGMKPGGHE